MKREVFKHECPDLAGQILGTGYNRFVSHCGIDGLAKENGDRLNLLAVGSSNPGTGQFRNFIAECKRFYKTICIWECWNPILPPILERYGFKSETEIQGDGEVLDGYRWDSEK